MTLTIKDIINKVDYLVKNNTSISYYFQEGDEEYDLYLENDYGEIYLKLNENDKLNSIAKGCFYNFDSLVINLHTFSLNIQNYTNYKKYNKLENY